MSDLNDARRNLAERLRSTGASRETAQRMAEASIRRVAEKVNRGENPDPKADDSTRQRFKEQRRNRE